MASSASSQQPWLSRRLPRQARSRALVEALLVAAERVLLERGLHDTTMSDIAKVAGASIGSLYQYFPNKQELVAAMLERRAHLVTGHVLSVAASAYAKPFEQGLRALIGAVLEAFLRDRKLYAALLSELDHIERPQSMRAAMNPVIEATTAFLHHYRTSIRVDPDRAAYLLTIGGAAVIQDAIRGEDEQRFSWLEDELYALAHSYLGL